MHDLFGNFLLKFSYNVFVINDLLRKSLVIAICFDAMYSSRVLRLCKEKKRKEEEKERETCVYVAALFDHIKFINPPLVERREGGCKR